MRVPFATPFLAAEPRATALLDDGFRRPEAWRAEAAARCGRPISPGLIAAIRKRASSQAQQRNLAALDDGAVAVVTGQQVGIFLGPLYTFYKAASAIAWARAISEATGARCVPLFWLQTEDHDYAEIASCELPPTLSLPASDARCSVAHLALPAAIGGLVETLADVLAPQPHAAAIVELVRSSYQEGRNLADAFAAMLGAIFADEGLLILDPRCPEVAREAAPLYATAIERAGEIDAALLRRSTELEQAGLREQVNVRAGSPLVFFHGANPEGARRRLQHSGAAFQLDGGGSTTAEELLDAARREPLRFSASALLRPVIQDALLPSVVYVGGPAEIGYLSQTAVLYPIFGVRPALAALRARFRIVDASGARALKALELMPAELEAPRDVLLARLGSRRAGSPEDLARRLLADLPQQLEASAKKHPALDRAAQRTRLSVEHAVKRFAERHARLVAEQDQTLSDRIDRLQETLFPHGEPQERRHALPLYAARYGLDTFKAMVLDRIRPPAFAVQDLVP